MPSHYEHKRIDRLLTGREYPEVHKLLDIAHPFLGPHHRQVGHDQEAVAIAFLLSGGDLGALVSAEAHIIVDQQDTFIKKTVQNLFPQKKANKRKLRR